jgi:CBS domain containing-hemolysin-like protein
MEQIIKRWSLAREMGDPFGLFVRVTGASPMPFVILHLPEEEVHEGTVTEDELKSLVDAGHEEGFLEQDEREMIYSIFQLGDTLAREIMVPRIYITGLDVSLPLPQAVEALLVRSFAVPVYEETIDHIVGLLYAKDLLSQAKEISQGHCGSDRRRIRATKESTIC